MDQSVETNIDLAGQSISLAAARLTELAAQMDYHAVANGPRTFQLIRRRRQRMRVKTESMTLTFVEDRSGPRVRVVGDVDVLLLEHLTGRTGPDLIRDAADIPITAEPEFTPVFKAPVVQYELPRSDARAVRPAMPAAGMISAVPGSPAAQTTSTGSVLTPTTPALGQASNGVADVLAGQACNGADEHGGAKDTAAELSAMTVKRDRVAPAESSASTIVTADGTTRPFVRPIVVGRNPNPLVGPPGADILALADPSLSKSHCVMVIVGEQLVVTDMHSLNGTRIEAQGADQQLVPGQASRPVDLPALVWAGEARIAVAPGAGGSS